MRMTKSAKNIYVYILCIYLRLHVYMYSIYICVCGLLSGETIENIEKSLLKTGGITFPKKKLKNLKKEKKNPKPHHKSMYECG